MLLKSNNIDATQGSIIKKILLVTFLIIFIVTLSLCIYSVFVPYPPVDYSTNDVNTDVAEIKNNLIELPYQINSQVDISKYSTKTNNNYSNVKAATLNYKKRRKECNYCRRWPRYWKICNCNKFICI